MIEFDTGHSDAVNDVQLDYYGRRAATASSDCKIRIFDATGEESTGSLLAELEGHGGPVWRVAWAHPKYGSILASCSFDNTAIVWKETASGWMQIYQSDGHLASVNGISWAAYDVGLILATASSDGTVCLDAYQSDGSWTQTKIPGADAISCTSISWAPSGLSGAVDDISGSPGMRFAVGGCENLIKIYSQSSGQWRADKKLVGHTDWVLDIAWAPITTSTRNCIASVGVDGKTVVWKEKPDGSWEQHIVNTFSNPVSRVAWSVTGSVLAVSDSDRVSLWKESHPSGRWTQLNE